MKDIGYYETNPVPYPKCPSKPVFDRPTVETVRAYDEYEEDMTEYHKQLAEYRDAQNRLYNEFKSDSLAQCELTKHSKANAIFDYVWRKNQYDGLQSVFDALEELSEMVWG